MTRDLPSLRLMLTIIMCLILAMSRAVVAYASQPGNATSTTATAVKASRLRTIEAPRPGNIRLKPLRPLAAGEPPNIYLVDLANGSFTSATGGLPEIDNVTSVSDTPATTVGFTLQLNTNTFSTPLCNGISGCGWVQFVYDSGGGVNIQAWLINYYATF